MENSGEWHKYDKLSWLFQIQLVQLNGGSRFRGAGADVTKMNKGYDMKPRFLENIAIFTSQTKGLKKGLQALKHLPLDSFLMS